MVPGAFAAVVVTTKRTTVEIPVAEISDWPSFHEVFRKALGFPSFYGCNMDAWVDCISSLDDADEGTTTVTVAPGEILTVLIRDALDFKARCPEQYEALIEPVAFVNDRRAEVGQAPVVALLPIGRRDRQ